MLLLLVLSVGPAAASTKTSTWTIVAPYHGAVQPSSSATWTGCGKAKIASLDRFSLRTGLGGYSGSSGARSCSAAVANNGGVSSGTSQGVSQVWVNLPGLHGNRSVTVNWTFSIAATETIHYGTCSGPTVANSCYRYAGWSVSGYYEIYDRTNGTNLFGGSWPGLGNASYYDSWCEESQCSSEASGGNGTFNYTATSTASWNIVVVGAKGGHQYALAVVITTLTFVECSAWGVALKGCSGSAKVEMSTPSHGVQLDSITVS